MRLRSQKNRFAFPAATKKHDPYRPCESSHFGFGGGEGQNAARAYLAQPFGITVTVSRGFAPHSASGARPDALHNYYVSILLGFPEKCKGKSEKDEF